MEQQQAVCAVLLESEKRDVRLLMPFSKEFIVAQEVNEILKTFHFATEIISAEKYPTIGIVHPLIHKLFSVTLKEADGDTTLVKSIKAAVKADLKERHRGLNFQKVMKIGTYLDPHFKKLTYLGDVSRSSVRLEAKDELVAIIKEDHERLTTVESVDSMDSVASVSTAPHSKKRNLACLLGDILETSVKCHDQTEDEIAEAELRCYESEPGESLDCQQPLEWWKARSINYNSDIVYKYLSKLAKKILCMTPTSVPSEKIFSTAGNIVSKMRSCLSPEHINHLVFLYENDKLF